MTRQEMDAVELIFEIAMHSMKTEEICLQQERIERARDRAMSMETMTAVTAVSYDADIVMRAEVLGRKRSQLFELFKELKVTE